MNIFKLQEMAETQGASSRPAFLGKVVSSIAGSVAGGLIGKASAKSQNKAAQQAAAQANQWTNEQLKSRHQWEVRDLKNAGLNPVLSAGGTPSIGGSAMAPVVGEMDQMQKGVEAAASAAQMKLIQEQVKNVAEDTELKRENQAVAKTTAAAQTAAAMNSVANANLADANSAVAAEQRKSVMADWKGKTFELQGKRNQFDFDRDMKTAPQWLKFLNGMFGAAGSAKSLAK